MVVSAQGGGGGREGGGEGGGEGREKEGARGRKKFVARVPHSRLNSH